MPNRINKDHFEPAYAQLAAILRRQIAAGVYPPGQKIPSESAISKEYRIAPMTVRQRSGYLRSREFWKEFKDWGPSSSLSD